jgi:hypothetical protein
MHILSRQQSVVIVACYFVNVVATADSLDSIAFGSHPPEVRFIFTASQWSG